MTKVLKSIVLSLLMFINVLMSIAFLVTSYASYLHPKEFWVTGFLGLFFPYFFFCLLFLLVFWLFVRKWWALLSFFVLIAGYRSVVVHFPFNWSDDFFCLHCNNTIKETRIVVCCFCYRANFGSEIAIIHK